jgi:antitoxin MazE
MRTRVQKWGNSLALRIPKSLVQEARLEQDTLVELSVVEGRLVVHPVPASGPTLEELLAGVTDENLHGEVEMGSATGNEVW